MGTEIRPQSKNTWNMSRIILLFALLLISADWTTGKTYDYIVVGGGTAGSVVAERLSRDPKNKVLVIDRGDDASDMMANTVAIWNTPYLVPSGKLNWFTPQVYFTDSFFSQETTLGNRSMRHRVSNIHGGGSAINGGVASRFSQDDLASFNNPLWTYDLTLDAWKYLERCQGNSCDPAYHGLNGSIVFNTFPLNSVHQELTNLMPAVFGVPFNNDSSGPIATGVSLMPRNLEVINGKPTRQDTFSKMLKPALNRPNLKFVKGFALKMELRENGKNRVFYESNNEINIDTAKYEVIVSMGTFRSAQFLMLSGIGNCTKLTQLGIECVIDNPEVGKNLQDSVLLPLVYATSALPTQPAPAGGTVVVYYKSPSFNVDNGTDMELAIAPVSPLGNVFLFQAAQLRHSGVGEMNLFSSSPYRYPLFTLNFWANDADAAPLVDQFKKIRQLAAVFMATTGKLLVEQSPGYATVPLNASDAAILAYLKATITTDEHAIGTCSINKVVDGRARVMDKNGVIVPGVRVADNSIIPTAPRTHSTSTGAMLIGSYVSQLILEDAANCKRSLMEQFVDIWSD